MGLQRTGQRFRRCRYVDDNRSLEIQAGKIVDPLFRDIQTITGKDEEELRGEVRDRRAC